jgi:hypothetical protein
MHELKVLLVSVGVLRKARRFRFLPSKILILVIIVFASLEECIHRRSTLRHTEVEKFAEKFKTIGTYSL